MCSKAKCSGPRADALKRAPWEKKLGAGEPVCGILTHRSPLFINKESSTCNSATGINPLSEKKKSIHVQN